jgi:hypothetical protein
VTGHRISGTHALDARCASDEHRLLRLIGEDLHVLYQRANDTIRRLINQAIFKALYICDEAVIEDELAEPFLQLHAFQAAINTPANSSHKAQQRQRCPANAKGPDPYRGREPFRVGSNNATLVRSSGLEPPRAVRPTRPSTSFGGV